MKINKKKATLGLKNLFLLLFFFGIGLTVIHIITTRKAVGIFNFGYGSSNQTVLIIDISFRLIILISIGLHFFCDIKKTSLKMLYMNIKLTLVSFFILIAQAIFAIAIVVFIIIFLGYLGVTWA